MAIKIKIPTNLSDITIRQYVTFLNETENQTDHEKAVTMVSIFCNLTREQVNQLPASDFDMIVTDMNGILESDPKHERIITHAGVQLGFVPNLDECTLGEVVAMDELIQDVKSWGEAMSVFYRPIIKKINDHYDIEPYKPNKIADLSDLPLSVALGVQVFFYDLRNDLIVYTQKCTEEALRAKGKLSSLKNGDGKVQSIDLLAGLSLIDKQSLTRTYTKPLFGLLTNPI